MEERRVGRKRVVRGPSRNQGPADLPYVTFTALAVPAFHISLQTTLSSVLVRMFGLVVPSVRRSG